MSEQKQYFEKLMENLVQRLYPAIQYQLLGLDTVIPQLMLGDRTQQGIAELVKEIQAEFQSLIVYESKLVFPGISKWFLDKTEGDLLPYVMHLLALTRSKEQRLMRLVTTLQKEQFKVISLQNKARLSALTDIFLSGFQKEKAVWNAYLDACMEAYRLESNGDNKE